MLGHVTFVSFVESKECLTCHIQLFISHNILSWMTLATFIKLSSLLQHKACIYLLLLWLFSFLQMQLGLICCLQFVFVSFFNGWNSQKELSSMLMFVPCSVTEPTTGLWLPYTVMLEWQQLLRHISSSLSSSSSSSSSSLSFSLSLS